MKILIPILIILIFLAGYSAYYFKSQADTLNQLVNVDEIKKPTPTPHIFSDQRLFDLVNAYRKENGLRELRLNKSLCESARERFPALHKEWSHGNALQLIGEKVNFSYAGENLARGYNYEDEVLQGWIDSPGHKENLDNPHYTDTCIVSETGISEDNHSYTRWVVQQFVGF